MHGKKVRVVLPYLFSGLPDSLAAWFACDGCSRGRGRVRWRVLVLGEGEGARPAVPAVQE